MNGQHKKQSTVLVTLFLEWHRKVCHSSYSFPSTGRLTPSLPAIQSAWNRSTKYHYLQKMSIRMSHRECSQRASSEYNRLWCTFFISSWSQAGEEGSKVKALLPHTIRLEYKSFFRGHLKSTSSVAHEDKICLVGHKWTRKSLWNLWL